MEQCMKKLWEKETTLDPVVEAFETKDDLAVDQKLVSFDILGSLAHAKGLEMLGRRHRKFQRSRQGCWRSSSFMKLAHFNSNLGTRICIQK